MKICLTGHRPSKIYGYDLNKKEWQDLKNKLKEILVAYDCDEAITGMALGCDTIFAIAVLELKHEGYPIDLRCAVPFKGQENKWTISDIERYKKILQQADFVDVLSEEKYSPKLLQDRNEYMVNNSDLVIAVWDGEENGGTYNCIKYAKTKNKDIIYINPKQLEQNIER